MGTTFRVNKFSVIQGKIDQGLLVDKVELGLIKKCQKLDFQSEFSMSKLIRIFLKKNFIEEYQFRRTFFVKSIFC